MKIDIGTRLKITHCRKGVFEAVAISKFDTSDEWFDVITLEPIKGCNPSRATHYKWGIGDRIPCRGEFCDIAKFKSTYYEDSKIVLREDVAREMLLNSCKTKKEVNDFIRFHKEADSLNLGEVNHNIIFSSLVKKTDEALDVVKNLN